MCEDVAEVAMVVDNPLPAEIKVNNMVKYWFFCTFMWRVCVHSWSVDICMILVWVMCLCMHVCVYTHVYPKVPNMHMHNACVGDVFTYACVYLP